MSVVLRHYQMDVIERGRQRLIEGVKRLLIQGSTGAGKTHVGCEIVRRAWQRGKRILWLAHRRRLVEQASERLDEFEVPHGVLMAGMSTTAAAPVQVASRDTILSRTVRNRWSAPPPADLVIVDEAHNLGRGYRDLLGLYEQATIVGLTATPTTSDGRGMGTDVYQALECTVPTSQLVREGWLVPVRCFAPEGVKAGSKRQLAGNPVQHWLRYGQGRPTVLFASRVAESLAVVDAFRRANIPAEHIDSKTPHGERDSVIRRVRSGETKIVANVGIWTEGVDIPELSCCILLRIAGSYVLFAQAVGRIMRRHPTKTDAILLDHSGAVLQHGFPDEDVSWSLNPDETVDQRIRKAKEKGERKAALCCRGCGCLFHLLLSCPQCGLAVPRKKKEAPRQDALLIEMARGQNQVLASEARERLWTKALYIAAARQGTCGMAAQIYRRDTGSWPEDSFRDLPQRDQWQTPILEVFPHLGMRRKSS